MYPLATWKRDELVARLDALIEHGFHQEAAVATAQVLEQAFKRALRSEMVKRRVTLDPEDGTVVPARNKEALDQALRDRAQSMTSLVVMWNKVMNGGQPRIPNFVDEVCGRGTWGGLKSRGKTSLTLGLPRKTKVHMGLFPLRHALVHGTYSPTLPTIRAVARHGREVAHLLMEDEVWTSRGLRSPHLRTFPFRKRQADRGVG